MDRIVSEKLNTKDMDFLSEHGHTFDAENSVEFTGFASRWANRLSAVGTINYVLLVPTLRCDLSCDYCQVSRVQEKATGFDWNEDTLKNALLFLGNLASSEIKIEFQGGEPLLRLDILTRVREFCRNHFRKSEFVVCTNLQNVSTSAWEFFSSADTHISTSLDGTFEIHQMQRTKEKPATSQFQKNLFRALTAKDLGRVSALPTIDPRNPPNPDELITTFADLGMNSIFLRPINYLGFARKKYNFGEVNTLWTDYYRKFVNALITHNATSDQVVEEYYLTHILRRIFRGGHNNHVDLRNPNWLGSDYVVIDYDGLLYPTDEARMITRVGQVDLCVGNVKDGFDRSKLDLLNTEASNLFDPDCCHCVYQPFCGVDRIDEISRYGRIDISRHLTDHCQKHMSLFDLAFELVFSTDLNTQKSLAAWLDVPNFSEELAPRHL